MSDSEKTNDKEQIFRQKSIDKVSSPDDLGNYIRVTNPGIWFLLTGIVVLLVGACIWGVFGHLETKVNAVCVADNGAVVCYVGKSDITRVNRGMTVRVNNAEFEVDSISTDPVRAGAVLDRAERGIAGYGAGDWVYAAGLTPKAASGETKEIRQIDNGSYAASIIVESIHPMSFVFN